MEKECSICNKNVGIEKLELDHIIPISKASTGFNYTKDHIIPTYKSCNCSKGSKLLGFLEYKNLVLLTMSLNKDKEGD